MVAAVDLVQLKVLVGDEVQGSLGEAEPDDPLRKWEAHEVRFCAGIMYYSSSLSLHNPMGDRKLVYGGALHPTTLVLFPMGSTHAGTIPPFCGEGGGL